MTTDQDRGAAITSASDDIFWSLKTVRQKTGLSSATIYRYMAVDLFPARRKLGRIVWVGSHQRSKHGVRNAQSSDGKTVALAIGLFPSPWSKPHKRMAASMHSASHIGLNPLHQTETQRTRRADCFNRKFLATIL